MIALPLATGATPAIPPLDVVAFRTGTVVVVHIRVDGVEGRYLCHFYFSVLGKGRV